MVYRIYVEKKEGLAHEAQSLKNDLTSLLQIEGLTDVRLLNRYDVENIDEALFASSVKTVFSEPQLDTVYTELPQGADVVFAVEYLPGQFDQRADSAAQCIQIISQGERPLIRTAKVYALYGELTAEEKEKFIAAQATEEITEPIAERGCGATISCLPSILMFFSTAIIIKRKKGALYAN